MQRVTLLFAFLDETFKTLSTIGRACFTAKAESKSSEYSAFSAAVVSNDEVYQRAKSDS